VEKRLFDSFSGLWIGLCALACILDTRLLVGQGLVLQAADCFVFGSIVGGYQVARGSMRHGSLLWLGGGGVAWGGWHLGGEALLGAALAAGCWTAYYGPGTWALLRGRSGTTAFWLRGHPWLKAPTVAAAWACLTVLVPIWGKADAVGLWWAERFAFIYALALAYDLFDLEYDRRQGQRTLATRLGSHSLLLLIAFVLLVCGELGAFSGVFLHHFHAFLCPLAAFSVIWWLHAFPQETTRAKFVIDGLMVAKLVIDWSA
jgi:hypothetical protein